MISQIVASCWLHACCTHFSCVEEASDLQENLCFIATKILATQPACRKSYKNGISIREPATLGLIRAIINVGRNREQHSVDN